MNTSKSKKSSGDKMGDLPIRREPSFTRRSVVKAGWMIPVVLAVGLPPGDLFAQGSNPQSTKTGGSQKSSPPPQSNRRPKQTHGRPSLF